MDEPPEGDRRLLGASQMHSRNDYTLNYYKENSIPKSDMLISISDTKATTGG